MTTTIQIEDKTWVQLNKRKQRGETFDKLINRMLLEFPIYKKLPKVSNDYEVYKKEVIK